MQRNAILCILGIFHISQNCEHSLALSIDRRKGFEIISRWGTNTCLIQKIVSLVKGRLVMGRFMMGRLVMGSLIMI